MRYYIIAGEASGDLHGASLMEALTALDPQAEYRAWGGEKMENQGAVLVRHYKELAFMGFVEVIRHLPRILQNLRFCKRDIMDYKPDALILIDYPGFNLRIAQWAADRYFKVFYYISPQLWAWKEKRVEIIRKSVDRLFAILPFEKEFYAGHGIAVEYVGHPLVDLIDTYLAESSHAKEENTIALLPGSRRMEISKMLPVYAEAAKAFPGKRFLLAAAPHFERAFYAEFGLDKIENLEIIEGDSYRVLSRSSYALTTSGTATLETALFGIPQVVCYRGNYLSYLVARRLIKVPYISLVNLILGRKLVDELIQDDCNPERIKASMEKLFDPASKERILLGYSEIRNKLGKGGAAHNTASHILSFLQR